MLVACGQRHLPSKMTVRSSYACRTIVVEDVQLSEAFRQEHACPAGAVSRRMVFTANQALVQSEALMAPPAG